MSGLSDVRISGDLCIHNILTDEIERDTLTSIFIWLSHKKYWGTFTCLLYTTSWRVRSMFAASRSFEDIFETHAKNNEEQLFNKIVIRHPYKWTFYCFSPHWIHSDKESFCVVFLFTLIWFETVELISRARKEFFFSSHVGNKKTRWKSH